MLVIEVSPASPAEEAGLQGGDTAVDIDGNEVMLGGDVITQLEDEPVAAMQELRQVLMQYKAGDEVTLQIVRDGKTMDIEVILAATP